jgi:hypothetical protein
MKKIILCTLVTLSFSSIANYDVLPQSEQRINEVLEEVESNYSDVFQKGELKSILKRKKKRSRCIARDSHNRRFEGKSKVVSAAKRAALRECHRRSHFPSTCSVFHCWR